MDFRKPELDFEEVDRRYAQLKRQLASGSISTEEFDAQRQLLMVQDDEGRWWAKSRKTGEWNYHDGSSWVGGTPPGYQPPRTPPAQSSMPNDQSQLKQSERVASSQTSLLGSAPVQDQNRGRQHRGRLFRVLGIVIVILGVAMVIVGVYELYLRGVVL